MELLLLKSRTYTVKKGQTLGDVAEAFGVPARAIAAKNGLLKEVEAGQVLVLPPAGNLYVVQGGESKRLLCGSNASFEEKNGTSRLYVGQTVLL